jgi:hypothetical protein
VDLVKIITSFSTVFDDDRLYRRFVSVVIPSGFAAGHKFITTRRTRLMLIHIPFYILLLYLLLLEEYKN